MSKNAKIISYRNLNGLFNQVKKAIKSSDSKKYIYAYWPELDRHHHLYGVDSDISLKHFNEIDKKLREFIVKEWKNDKNFDKLLNSCVAFIRRGKNAIQ